MNRISQALAIGGAALAIAAPAYAQNPARASATAFVKALYDGYAGPAGEKPFYNRKGVFHPALAALIARNQKLLGGEADVLGADPFCECQDGTPKLERSNILTITATEARVGVAIVNESQRSNLTLRLRLVGKAWRVWDIGSKTVPSLQAALIRENRDAAAK